MLYETSSSLRARCYITFSTSATVERVNDGGKRQMNLTMKKWALRLGPGLGEQHNPGQTACWSPDESGSGTDRVLPEPPEPELKPKVC